MTPPPGLSAKVRAGGPSCGEEGVVGLPLNRHPVESWRSALVAPRGGGFMGIGSWGLVREDRKLVPAPAGMTASVKDYTVMPGSFSPCSLAHSTAIS